ncbi:amidohydrolase family protein [Secundilactobacillus malefermentans]|uniref:Amidohydrolase-related domain-containing protein n=1 Tax=Secundilactobacillus malefermentans TaxID=176292 RepID=A0A4R5NDZ8_9LACO|nr:amidohydrolase family protein [Secundilactobacillus malefermentans]KRM58588.1 aminocarboxymuconate-semialdehyde decarboxylase [Secundilactobacillus malefermentans DSM 5705 = KCTC 3548]QEA31091.1 amidohydrolase [Secundilactobacillus malefermentans]TDG71163.1 hypothetical protein C5L31_001850 [Secundilactobacillus malefermentans]
MIDVFAHVLAPKFLKKMLEVAPDALEKNSWMKNPLLTDLSKRIATMETDQQQIISMVNLNPEDFTGVEESVNLCRQANDELESIVKTYPNQFPAFVAMLPMNDIQAALKLIDQQVVDNPLAAGVQLFTRAMQKPIASEEFEPIFAKMVQIGKPIWLHPVFDERKLDNNLTFGWEYEQTLAMNDIVNKGYFDRFPGLKIIVHHAGAMVPYFAQRIYHIQGQEKYQVFKKFYVDTALLGNSGALALAVSFFGIDHVLFGTDTPLGIAPDGPTEVIKQAILAMNLSEAEKNQIFSGNWQQLKS